MNRLLNVFALSLALSLGCSTGGAVAGDRPQSSAPLSAPIATQEEREDGVILAGKRAAKCSQRRMRELFRWSLAETKTSSHNATMAEVITGANVDAFLACPKSFLRTLKQESAETRDAVSYYFGIFDRELVAAKLSKLAADAEVGAFVREHFSSFYESDEE